MNYSNEKSDTENNGREYKFSLVVGEKPIFHSGDEHSIALIFWNLTGFNSQPHRRPTYKNDLPPEEDYAAYLKMMRAHFNEEFPLGVEIAMISPEGQVLEKNTIGGLAPTPAK